MYFFLAFRGYKLRILFDISAAEKDYNIAKEHIKYNKARLIANDIKKI